MFQVNLRRLPPRLGRGGRWMHGEAAQFSPTICRMRNYNRGAVENMNHELKRTLIHEHAINFYVHVLVFCGGSKSSNQSGKKIQKKLGSTWKHLERRT